MSEQWPPEWNGPGDPDEAEYLDAGRSDAGYPDAGYPDTEGLHPDVLAEYLSEVTSALASAPVPAMPDSLESRISAAIADEAATRTRRTGAVDVSATARSLSPEPLPAAGDSGAGTAPRTRSLLPGRRRAGGRAGTSRPAGSRPVGSRPVGSRPAGRWGRRLVSAPAMGSLSIVLLVAGFIFLVSHGMSSSSSSSAPYSEAGPVVTSGASRAASGSSVLPKGEPVPAHVPSNTRDLGFSVRKTGTRYEYATLAVQVRDALAATPGGSSTVAAPAVSSGLPVPSASAHDASGSKSLATGSGPSAALAGCVDRLTGGVTPSLVDRATYAGRPAYVIAVPGRAWVVGLGCTATSTELITTVSLAGLSGKPRGFSGNLRALGSVERRAIGKRGACSDRRT